MSSCNVVKEGFGRLSHSFRSSSSHNALHTSLLHVMRETIFSASLLNTRAMVSTTVHFQQTRRLHILVIILGNLGLINSTRSHNLWFPGSFGLYGISTLVTSNERWLYIDGGEVRGNTSSYYATGSSLAIDLSVSWTIDSVKISKAFDKPNNFPFALNPSIWWSQSDRKIYSYGGLPLENRTFTGCHDSSEGCRAWKYQANSAQFEEFVASSKRTPLWQLDTDDSGLALGEWYPSPRDVQPGSDISTPIYEPQTTYGDGNFWSFGGRASTFLRHPLGLLKFNGATKTWTELESVKKEGLTGGHAIFASSFGTHGVLIFFGPWYYSNSNNLNKVKVFIYDIGTGKMHSQASSGDINHSTLEDTGACAAGVQDKHGHLDIFFYGMTVERVNGENRTVDSMNVLSIPSFRWTSINTPKNQSFNGHSCEVVGRRQMVSVGGKSNGNTNPISVFDMSALSWSSSYDANAMPYEPSKLLKEAHGGQEYPPNWNDPALGKIFGAPLPTDSSHIAIIWSAVAGGIVVIVLVAIIMWCYLHRRRKLSSNSCSKGLRWFEQNHNESKHTQYGEAIRDGNLGYQSSKISSVSQHEAPCRSSKKELACDEKGKIPTSTLSEIWKTEFMTAQSPTRHSTDNNRRPPSYFPREPDEIVFNTYAGSTTYLEAPPNDVSASYEAFLMGINRPQVSRRYPVTPPNEFWQMGTNTS